MNKILLTIIIVILTATFAFAGTISKNGIAQGDLYNLLSKMVTMVNEIKTDHNALVVTNREAFGAYSTTVKVLNTTATDLSLTQ